MHRLEINRYCTFLESAGADTECFNEYRYFHDKLSADTNTTDRQVSADT